MHRGEQAMTPGRDVTELLRQARRRWLLVAGCEAAGRGALGAGVLLAAALGAAGLLDPAGLGATVLWTAAAAASLVWAVMAVWPLRRRPSLARVARFVEEQNPDLEDRLTTALEVSTTGRASKVAGLQLADAAARVAALDLGGIVDRDRRRRAFRLAALAGVGLAIAVLLTGPALWRTAGTLARLAVPRPVSIDVSPGDARVARGTPLEVRARVTGESAIPAWNEPRLFVTDAGGTRSVPMARDADGHTATVEAREDFSYRVETAVARTAEHRVTVLSPPTVERIDVHYDYPAYTGLAPRTDEDGGDVYAPAGTRVRFEIRTNPPAVSGRLALAAGASVPLEGRADGVLEGRLEVERDDAYRVALADANGLRKDGDTEYFIKVLADRPPEVRILRPASDRRVTPLEEVTIEARAEDDYGVESLELVYAVRGGKEQVRTLGHPRGALKVRGERVLYLEELDVKPGDFVTYYARARDVGRGRRAIDARSDLFFLEVTPFGEEFSLAQSQAMAGGSGEMMDLAGAQKDIIVATWRLERRAMGGRSRADGDALTAAQRELRVRTEEAASRGQDEAAAPGGGNDAPLARATAAMRRAESLLAVGRTKDALAPEMEAYNELLREEARRRRTQVARSQGRGGGASTRQMADLSTLFDRELRRLQQTNYETRSSTESRGRASQTDALERVRELARRQQTLNRQEQELARQRDGLTEDELRRRLERLTREQIELRQEAEELERQLAQERAGEGAEARGGQPGDRRQALRDAATDMQGGTSELRRQEPGEAGAKGASALEGLRRLEALLEQDLPDAARHALGEAQLEARQVADAQRRLATEAGRPGITDETRRELAAEEGRLAGRVDDLAQALRRVAGQAEGEAADRAGDGARELEREAVSRRMREVADALRAVEAQAADRAGPDAAQAGEQADQVARALESFADRVGARVGDGRDVQELSEALRRTRELEGRLEQLEERLEAERARGDGQGSASRGERPGGRPAAGGASAAGELARLEEAYRPALEELRSLSEQVERQGTPGQVPRAGGWSLSAPGTEAFKRDPSAWDALRRDVHATIDELEGSLAARLAERLARERLSAADDAVPEAYRALVAEYYEAIAAVSGKR